MIPNKLRRRSGGSADTSSSSSGSHSTTVIDSDPEPEPDPEPDVKAGGPGPTEPTSSRPPGLGKELDDSDNDGQADIVEPPAEDTETTATTMDDPFDSGKTGSEIMAEGGDPSAVVTSDPHASSLEDKIAKDGLAETVGQFQNMAWDGDDGSSPTFDSVPNTEAGADAIKDAGESFVEAAQNVASQGGPSGETPENTPAAPEMAQFIPVPMGGSSDGGGLGKALLAVLAVAVAFVFGGD